MTSMNRFEKEAFEISEFNRADYMKNLNSRNEDFKVRISDFKKWLIENDKMDYFLQEVSYSEPDIFGIAIDFSIPVTMVKYFRKGA